MKKIIMVVTALIIGIPLNSHAWAPENSAEPGFHEIIIEDSVSFFRRFSFLNTWDKGNFYVCADMKSGKCQNNISGNFNVIFPICETVSQRDCIAVLTVSTASQSHEATFERYTMPNHPSLFKGDGKRLPLSVASPSLWDIASLPHAGGTKYAVHVGLDGDISSGRITKASFYAQIYAVEEVPGRGEEFDQNNYSNFSWCDFNPVTRKQNGCGGGGNTDSHICVVQFQVGGTCGAKHQLPSDASFALQVRLSKETNGWYHGRLQEPGLNLEKISNGVALTIIGKPVEVPIVYHSGLYQDFAPAVQKYWDSCVKDVHCPKSTREFGADHSRQKASDRNLTSEQKAWTPGALKTTKFFSKVTGGLTPKVEQVWAVRTLENVSNRTAKCFSSAGLKGLISTNASAYSDGPPSLVNGVLKYSLAAPSRVQGTDEDIIGSYDLVMRASFASCVYGSKALSPRAEITVTGAQSDFRVATSVTSKTKDWIRLTAKNFDY